MAFDRQWRSLMARATERLDLTEVHEALEAWRRVAWVASAHGPESYRRTLASAQERRQSGERAPGALPWEHLKAELGFSYRPAIAAGAGVGQPIQITSRMSTRRWFPRIKVRDQALDGAIEDASVMVRFVRPVSSSCQSSYSDLPGSWHVVVGGGPDHVGGGATSPVAARADDALAARVDSAWRSISAPV